MVKIFIREIGSRGPAFADLRVPDFQSLLDLMKFSRNYMGII